MCLHTNSRFSATCSWAIISGVIQRHINYALILGRFCVGILMSLFKKYSLERSTVIHWGGDGDVGGGGQWLKLGFMDINPPLLILTQICTIMKTYLSQ